MDKSWLHHNGLKQKCGSINENALVLHPPNPARKFKGMPSACKAMLSVIWDDKDVSCVDYFQAVAMTRGSYCAGFVTKLRGAIKKSVVESREREHSSIPTILTATVLGLQWLQFIAQNVTHRRRSATVANIPPFFFVRALVKYKKKITQITDMTSFPELH